MPIERQKMNTLNKLIDYGKNTEKKITAMGIQDMLAVPKITVPEIQIITEMQDAIKKREIVAYLADAKDSDDEPEAADVQEEPAYEDTESEVADYGGFRF